MLLMMMLLCKTNRTPTKTNGLENVKYINKLIHANTMTKKFRCNSFFLSFLIRIFYLYMCSYHYNEKLKVSDGGVVLAENLLLLAWNPHNTVIQMHLLLSFFFLFLFSFVATNKCIIGHILKHSRFPAHSFINITHTHKPFTFSNSCWFTALCST